MTSTTVSSDNRKLTGEVVVISTDPLRRDTELYRKEKVRVKLAESGLVLANQ
jgi:hypothetical protein